MNCNLISGRRTLFSCGPVRKRFQSRYYNDVGCLLSILLGCVQMIDFDCGYGRWQRAPAIRTRPQFASGFWSPRALPQTRASFWLHKSGEGGRFLKKNFMTIKHYSAYCIYSSSEACKQVPVLLRRLPHGLP